MSTSDGATPVLRLIAALDAYLITAYDARLALGFTEGDAPQ